jgi:PAS domain S-box-containing protein
MEVSGSLARLDGTDPAATASGASTADQLGRELRWRWILDEMSGVVGVLAGDGRILELNRTALRHGGYVHQEVAGRRVWDVERWFPDAEDRARVRRAVEEAGAGSSVRLEALLPHDRHEGRAVFDLAFRPIPDRHGAIRLILLEGTDITGLRRAEEEVSRQNHELRELAARLRDVDVRRRRFITDISHELKTPLGITLGLTERMLDGEALGPAARRDVEAVRRNAYAVLAEVENLLTAARLDARHLALRPRPDDLPRIVRAVAASFEPVAAMRDVTLLVDTPAALRVLVDGPRMTTVLSNLLSNALKFSPASGTVRITLRGPADAVRLEVADSGPGIPERLRAAVFERFQQADDAPSGRVQGSGIGLSIVRDLVALHGGSVTVERAPEGGALFAVGLSLEPAPRAVTAPSEHGGQLEDLVRPSVERLRTELLAAASLASSPAAVTAVSLDERPRVVLVEDDVALAAQLKTLLADRYDVCHAESAERALELLQERMPAAVITDLALSSLSGADLVAELRRRREYDEVPVLVLSGTSEASVRAALLRAGAQDFIRKPVESEELSARIEAALRTAAHARELRATSDWLLAAFEAAPHPLALLRGDGTISHAGTSLGRLLGRTERELRGLRLDALSHPDDVGVEAEGVALCAAGKLATFEVRKRLLGPDGQELPVLLCFAAAPRAAERPEAAVVLQVQDLQAAADS